MKAHIFSCLAIICAGGVCIGQPTPEISTGKDLQAYYSTGKAPPWNAEVKNLSSDKPVERDKAANYLVALLDQAQADERSGNAPWRATPFWGGGAENPAQDLRGQIVKELSKAPASIASLSVIRWYLDREHVPLYQAIAMTALGKVDGKEADGLRLRILQPAHENSVVLRWALEQFGKRKTDLPDGLLKELCQHYRPSIRAAARKINSDRGGPDPGAFDNARAIQRPEVVALVTAVGALLDQTAATDAEFVKVTTEWTSGEETNTETTIGWLVKNDSDSWIVLTPFGHRENFAKEKKIKRRDGESTIKSRWEKLPIADEVNRVAALRGKGDPEFALSERGALTGQFEGHTASVSEVVLAHWLYTAKQFDLSAQLFLPALDTFYMDRHLVDMMRHRMSEAAGYRMLVAFAGDRDFAETQRLANALVQRYPGTRFHDHAVKLSKEMPKRGDDFKKLKLPTPEEWATLKKKLSRAEQITYLAERIRLLNCFQYSQPGGYSLTETQYAEPCGLSDNAAWGLYQGKTKVINPYLELVGGKELVFPHDDTKKPSKGMELTVADIPRLAPFLREDWHLLCVSFWRDFSADRHLGTTRPLFASIIDDLAKRDLCRVHAMAKMSDVEMEKQIESIVNWANANAGKNERDLLWEALDEQVSAGAYFSDLSMSGNLDELIGLKDKRLGPVLLQYLNDFEKKGVRPNPNAFKIEGLDSNSYELRRLMGYCRAYDPAMFKESVRKLGQHKNLDVRLESGYMLFAGGDIDEGRKILANILENGSPWGLEEYAIPQLVETLLKEGSKESKEAVRLVFKNKRYTEIREGPRVMLVKDCIYVGIGEAYLSYLPLLDIKGDTIGPIGYGKGTVVGELIAAEIIEKLAPNDSEIIRIKKMFPKPADQIAPLKEWLIAKAKVLQVP
jgi:hypothetical protein